MRRRANVRAVGLRPRNLCFPDAERAGFHRRQQQPLREGVFFSWARRGLVSGGVFDHSTHEEDGPVTWEALASPRLIPVLRRAGDPSPTHDTLASARVVGLMAQN